MSVISAEAVLARWRAWGLALYQDEEGRIYPAAQQASAVLSLLTQRMSDRGIRLLTDTDVTAVLRDGERFAVKTSGGSVLTADSVVLATGGLAGGGLGNRNSDYALATGLGHRLTPLFPGLAPLEARMGKLKRLSGLRVPAVASLYSGERFVSAAAGEVLFTDYGVSGICIMQLARDAQRILAHNRTPKLVLDLSPIYLPESRQRTRLASAPADSYEKTLQLLRERKKQWGDGLLTGLIPDALAQLLPDRDPETLARALTALPLTITGVRPFAQAQITCGGIAAGDVDPSTMASRRCPGLYLAGEMLDVDGDCGGYNLQFAVASGVLAGQNAAE